MGDLCNAPGKQEFIFRSLHVDAFPKAITHYGNGGATPSESVRYPGLVTSRFARKGSETRGSIYATIMALGPKMTIPTLIMVLKT